MPHQKHHYQFTTITSLIIWSHTSSSSSMVVNICCIWWRQRCCCPLSSVVTVTKTLMLNHSNDQMPPIWATFSSSSASTSPSDSPLKENSKRKLTRQRKLRHVGDDELGLRPVKSLPASPDKDSESRSPHHWSRSAVPQPLPLPELSSAHRTNRSCDNLPSPRESSRGEWDPSSSPVFTR